MGCFEGAEACERVNTYILNQIKDNFEGHSLGVYRDDILVLMKGLFGLEKERMKKRVIKTFKDCKLEITIKGNLKIGNFLDVAFNLHKNTHKPYSKPDDLPAYIDVNSNHPPTTIRELPKSIGKRLSELSCNKKIFEKAIPPPYNDDFKKSGFKENLVYTPNTNTSNIFDKKQSKRKIIWFNPFCSVNVITNIGNKVLSLLKKHLPKKYKLDKIFNKNNTKISYNCKSNILSIIAGQNKLLPQPKVTKC